MASEFSGPPRLAPISESYETILRPLRQVIEIGLGPAKDVALDIHLRKTAWSACAGIVGRLAARDADAEGLPLEQCEARAWKAMEKEYAKLATATPQAVVWEAVRLMPLFEEFARREAVV